MPFFQSPMQKNCRSKSTSILATPSSPALPNLVEIVIYALPNLVEIAIYAPLNLVEIVILVSKNLVYSFLADPPSISSLYSYKDSSTGKISSQISFI